MKGKSCILIGGGGHAKVLIDVLKHNRYNIIGYSALAPSDGGLFRELSYLGPNSSLDSYDDPEIYWVNGIGSTGDQSKRKYIYEQEAGKGRIFPVLLHPTAYVASATMIGDGAQIMAGAVIQPGVNLGVNNIVNTRSMIDHDSVVGNHVHISSGAVLCGSVYIEDEAHIGAGAIIKQGIRIGKGSVVGAGAVVVNDVKPGTTVVGVPAREVSR